MSKKFCKIIRKHKWAFDELNDRKSIVTIHRVWLGVYRQKLYEYGIKKYRWYVPGMEAGFMSAIGLRYGYHDSKMMFYQNYPKI